MYNDSVITGVVTRQRELCPYVYVCAGLLVQISFADLADCIQAHGHVRLDVEDECICN